MDRDNTDDQADNKSPAPKKGYSIWSLLVIMTLLAVWLAVPRRATIEAFDLKNQLFFVFHQIALWTLVAIGCWLLWGRKKLVLVMSVIIIVLIWTPISWTLAEIAYSGKVGASVSIIDYMGLTSVYQRIYESIHWTFGYGPAN